MRSPDELHQSDGEPRHYSRQERRKAKSIIERWGVRIPIAVTPDNRVLNHFIIVTVARELGLQVPTVIVDDLTADEHDAISIAYAKLFEFGSFDQQLLGSRLARLEINLPTLSFDTLGLEVAEVDRAISAFQVGETVERPLELGPPVSRIGDIYRLGKNVVGCGDASDANWMRRLMPAPAAMVFTDPPYGCKVAGFVTTRQHREFVEASGELDAGQLADKFRIWCENIGRCTAPGAMVFLCIDWRSMPALVAAAGAVFGHMVNFIVWTKDRAGMGSLYRSQHELILLFRMPGGEVRNNVQLGRHGRDRSNVWRYPSAATFGKSGVEGDLLEDHPTPKPVDMIADAIRDTTRRGELVLDPFLGSGSTLIAAEKMGRLCCGSDLDSGYVDLAVRRWQAWTGRTAVHVSSGLTFDALTADRLEQGA